MKNLDGYYAKISRRIWEVDMSDKARLLFFWLKELEQKYTGADSLTFFHSNKSLAKEMRWSESSVKRAKRELIEKGFLTVDYTGINTEDDPEAKPKKICTYYIHG